MKDFRRIEAEKTRPNLVSKRAILKILIIADLKSDAILSIVDRNVAIFVTRHAITRYEFQASQGKLEQTSLTFCFPE